MNFGKNDYASRVKLGAINDIKKFMLKEENSYYIELGIIIFRFESRKFKFRKCKPININSSLNAVTLAVAV